MPGTGCSTKKSVKMAPRYSETKKMEKQARALAVSYAVYMYKTARDANKPVKQVFSKLAYALANGDSMMTAIKKVMPKASAEKQAAAAFRFLGLVKKAFGGATSFGNTGVKPVNLQNAGRATGQFLGEVVDANQPNRGWATSGARLGGQVGQGVAGGLNSVNRAGHAFQQDVGRAANSVADMVTGAWNSGQQNLNTARTNTAAAEAAARHGAMVRTYGPDYQNVLAQKQRQQIEAQYQRAMQPGFGSIAGLGAMANEALGSVNQNFERTRNFQEAASRHGKAYAQTNRAPLTAQPTASNAVNAQNAIMKQTPLQQLPQWAQQAYQANFAAGRNQTLAPDAAAQFTNYMQPLQGAPQWLQDAYAQRRTAGTTQVSPAELYARWQQMTPQKQQEMYARYQQQQNAPQLASM